MGKGGLDLQVCLRVRELNIQIPPISSLLAGGKTFDRYIIYYRNIKEPSTVPCGTPRHWP